MSDEEIEARNRVWERLYEELPKKAGPPAGEIELKGQVAAHLTPVDVRRAVAYSQLLDGDTEALSAVPKSTLREWINRTQFQRLVQQAMGAAGVTPERIAQKIDGLLDAQKVRYVSDGQGGVSERNTPDNETQLKAVRLAHEILMDSTESAPPEMAEVEQIRGELKELTVAELQQRAVLLNGSGHATDRGPQSRSGHGRRQ